MKIKRYKAAPSKAVSRALLFVYRFDRYIWRTLFYDAIRMLGWHSTLENARELYKAKKFRID